MSTSSRIKRIVRRCARESRQARLDKDTRGGAKNCANGETMNKTMTLRELLDYVAANGCAMPGCTESHELYANSFCHLGIDSRQRIVTVRCRICSTPTVVLREERGQALLEEVVSAYISKDIKPENRLDAIRAIARLRIAMYERFLQSSKSGEEEMRKFLALWQGVQAKCSAPGASAYDLTVEELAEVQEAIESEVYEGQLAAWRA